MRMRTFVREDGFTLIEMLVAVAVLGMLGLLAWRGLDALTRERQRIAEGIEETERIVRSLEQISKDVEEHVADVQHMGRVGPVTALPLSFEIERSVSGSAALRILRHRPDGSGSLWVRYGVEDGRLERTDSAATQPPLSRRTLLLTAVRDFRVRLLSADGYREAAVLQHPAGRTVPVVALEVSIERSPGERYVRVMPL